MKSQIVVIDTETGGLDPNNNPLLSIAAVDSENHESFTAIIAPSAEWICDPWALDKNGFTLEFLKKNGRPERDVVQDFALWLAQRRWHIVAGCNVSFDIMFLAAAFHRHGVAWPMGKRVDLQAAAWLAHETGWIELPLGRDGQPRLSLDHIAAALGHGRTGKAHNALEDALLTLACMRQLVDLKKESNEN